MDLRTNPFHVLQAHAADDRQRIMERYDERSLVVDAGDCRRARSELINPRKRLAAEVAWLPGVGPQRTQELVALAENGSSEFLDVAAPHAAQANLLAAGLKRISGDKPELAAAWILDLAWAFDGVQANQLCAVINADRTAAGFPQIELTVLEEEIGERRRYYQQVIRETLNALTPGALVAAVTLAVKIATLNGSKHGPILIDSMVDAYEVKIQSLLDTDIARIEQQIAAIRTQVSGSGRGNATKLNTAVHQLSREVKDWDALAQPLQVSMRSRGLDHDASFQVAGLVKQLAFELVYEHGRHSIAKQLIGLIQEVFAEVSKIAEQVPDDLAALDRAVMQRGIAKLQNEQYHEAIKDFDEALRLDPNSTETLYLRGLAHKALERYRDAITDFDRALQLDPELAVAYAERGIAKACLERYSDALTDFNRALQIDADFTMARYHRALVNIALERYRDAVTDFTRLLQDEPNAEFLYCQRGRAYVQLERYSDALADFNRALQLDPDYGEVRFHRALLNVGLKRDRDAITDFTWLLRHEPNAGPVAYERGLAYARLGQYRDALRDYNQALRLMPNETELYFHRGIANAELGRFHDAIDDFDTLLWRNPHFAQGYMLRGMAKESSGDPYGAQSDYRQAVQLDPSLNQYLRRY